jgi:hypothetical protein
MPGQEVKQGGSGGRHDAFDKLSAVAEGRRQMRVGPSFEEGGEGKEKKRERSCRKEIRARMRKNGTGTRRERRMVAF